MADWQGELHTGGQVTLDATGSGTVIVGPDNGSQRWEVREIIAWSTLSPGQRPATVAEVLVINESRGRGIVGHKQTSLAIHGPILVGPADYLTVKFTGGLAGITVFCKIEGTKLRRWS